MDSKSFMCQGCYPSCQGWLARLYRPPFLPPLPARPLPLRGSPFRLGQTNPPCSSWSVFKCSVDPHLHYILHPPVASLLSRHSHRTQHPPTRYPRQRSHRQDIRPGCHCSKRPCLLSYGCGFLVGGHLACNLRWVCDGEKHPCCSTAHVPHRGLDH